MKTWREKHLKRYRELIRKGQQKYKKSAKGKITEHKYRISPKNKLYNKIYREKNKEKIRAYIITHKAIKSGTLISQPCEVCNRDGEGLNGPLAHHDDYNKPLDIRWLCPEHHSKLHNLQY